MKTLMIETDVACDISRLREEMNEMAYSFDDLMIDDDNLEYIEHLDRPLSQEENNEYEAFLLDELEEDDAECNEIAEYSLSSDPFDH